LIANAILDELTSFVNYNALIDTKFEDFIKFGDKGSLTTL